MDMLQVTRAKRHHYFQQRCSVRIKENETADDAHASETVVTEKTTSLCLFLFYNLFRMMLIQFVMICFFSHDIDGNVIFQKRF